MDSHGGVGATTPSDAVEANLLTCGLRVDEYLGLSYFERVLVPWQELACDLAAECEATLRDAREALTPRASAAKDRQSDAAGVQVGGSASSIEVGGSLMAALQPGFEAADAGLRRASAPFREVVEEEGFVSFATLGLLAAAAPVGPAVAASSAVVLCGATIKLKGLLYIMYGLSSLRGARLFYYRFPGLKDQSLARNSALALACSGMGYIIMLPFLDMAPALEGPVLAARFVPDLICNPLIIWNFGYIAGKRPQDMVQTTAFAACSTMLNIASCVAPPHLAARALGGSVLCMLKVLYDLSQHVSTEAGELSSRNKLRTQISVDLLVFSWAGYPLLRGLTMAGSLPPDVELAVSVGFDVLSKLGVLHLLSRDSEAVARAARYLEDQAEHWDQ